MDTIDTESTMKSDPGDEVERLQELVNQLEVQNQLLRSKHCSDSDLKSKTKIDSVVNDSYMSKGNRPEASDSGNNTQEHKNSDVDGAVDDFDILDITTVPSLEDEESWLFTSPKKAVKQQPQHKISPYKWMRQEFESPEVEPAKRSLLYQLDEVERSSPVPTARSPIDTRTFTRPPNKIDTSTFTRPRKAIDTSTFTRPLKSGLATRQSPSNTLSTQVDSGRSLSPSHSPRNSSPRNTSPRNGSPRNSSPRNISPRNSPEYDRNGNASGGLASSSASTSSSSVAGAPSRVGDTVVDGTPPRNPAADVMDIQVMARMQEESLRQSINASPKKTFKGMRNLKQAQQQQKQQQQQQHQQGDQDSSESSNRSSPARFEGDMYQVHRSNNSLAGSLSSHSNSPPDSPYNSTQQLNRPVSEMQLRRSLPNLSGRHPSSSALLHSHPSDTSLQSRNTAAEPPPTLYTQTPRRLVKPPSLSQRGGYSSKPGSGVPRAIPSPSGGRGGIPRPRTSRLPAPRSRIPGAGGRPSPQASNHSNHVGDDSWKDGCF